MSTESKIPHIQKSAFLFFYNPPSIAGKLSCQLPVDWVVNWVVDWVVDWVVLSLPALHWLADQIPE